MISQGIPKVIIANKYDKFEECKGIAEVNMRKAESLAALWKTQVIKVSAKTGENVSAAFDNVIQKSIERSKTNPSPSLRPVSGSPVITLAQEKTEPQSDSKCKC